MRIIDWRSDVGSSDLVATPHRWLREARRNQPVFFMPKYGWYVVTRLDDITRIANDPGTFSNRMFVTVPEVPARFRARLPNGFPMKVDRKSVVWGKSVYVRVDLGGGRNIKKKKRSNINT